MKSRRNRKVLIRVDGSRAIGLGHVVRMRNLALALRKRGMECMFLSRPDPVVRRLLGSEGFRCCNFTSDRSLNEALRLHKPAIIIQDILRTSTAWMRKLKSLTDAPIINFDDTGSGLRHADAVINAIVFHWKKYRRASSRARLHEGVRYMILPRGFTGAPRAIPNRARRIVLAFGGTDNRRLTERTLDILSLSALPMNLRINLGPGRPLTPALRRAIRRSPHAITLLRSVPNLAAELRRADLVICAGGNMLYELAALGTPSACIASEPHERLNTAFWSRAGTTLALGFEKQLDRQRACDAICRLILDPRKRRLMSRRGRAAMDSRGLERVTRIIEGFMP